MDRSSMTKVETTKDNEKRLAFKAGLLSKIDSPTQLEERPTEDTFNGVSPGGRLFHPSLGEGTLIEVDHGNNEVLINFDNMGLIGLVLNQAKSFVHAPSIDIEAKISDDPFLGSNIQSRTLAPQDRDFREVDLSRLVSPDFINSEVTFFPEGSRITHPSLGEGTIIEVDKVENQVTIDFGAKGVVPLVLSQAKSFLKISTEPEVRVKDDPFLGSSILRDGPIKPAATQRELDTTKVISPDFKDSEVPFIATGAKVIHKDLGECTILAVDKAVNEIVLDTIDRGKISLVFSQVKSLLIPVESVRKSLNTVVDPFIGDKIQRDGPVKLDSAQRELDTTKVISPDFKDSEVPFIATGARVIHKDLGECTIISVDKKANEIVLSTLDKGEISLVFSQIRSVLTPVDSVRKETKPIEDPFLGSKILRDGPIKPSAVQRELDTTKVVSSDFKDPDYPFIAIGSKVIHRDLGECTIISVDKKTNEITLDTLGVGNISLIFSQVRSILTPVDSINKEIKAIDDPFLGDKILRVGPVKLDATQRELDTTKVVSPDFQDSDTPFIAVGGKLFNKELGECTILSVDKSLNEIILDSSNHGIVNLIFSQVRSALTPMGSVRKEAKVIDDPFFGSTILRDGPVKLDAIQRELDTSKVVSPDFIVPDKLFIPLGSSVWHPELGVCTVLEVDEKTNTLVLDNNGDKVELVLSQVRSKLRMADTFAEHVPMPPLVRDELATQIPAYTSRGEVTVSLPEPFKQWQREQQFMYLTRSQSLTTEQANDVFSVLDGNKPLFHSVAISWQSQEEIRAGVIQNSMETPISMTETKTSPSLVGQRLWHPDFGECSVASIEGNQLVLMTSVGQVPCVLDATLSKLAVIKDGAPIDHAPKQLAVTRVLVTSDTPISERLLVKVTIPETFVTWKEIEQYQYLTNTLSLTPDNAKDIISSMTGKLHSSKTEYEIQWTKDLPEASKRAEFKQQLLARIERSLIEPIASIPLAAVDSGMYRTMEEVTVVKKTPKHRVSIDLPTDFNNWTASGQYVFLTRTKQLTFNEANDVMDVLKGNTPQNGDIEYLITWGGSSIVQNPTDQRVNETTEESTIIKKDVLKKVQVTLPPFFKNWASSGQFGYLTRTRQLTFNEANDVLALFNGTNPISDIEYEIIWSE